MANKVALLILGVIIATSMGVGALVGLQFGPVGPTNPGGGNGTATGTANPSATATATAAGTPTATPGAAATATREATPTPTPTPQPTVAAAEFDRAEIEAEVLARVNTFRDEQSIQRLDSRSQIVEMARFHSENLAEQGYLSHAAGGFSTQDRYERFDLADKCKVNNNEEKGLLDGDELEVMAKTTAGRPYDAGGETRINRDEGEVADAVIRTWRNSQDARGKLSLENADEVGIGVVVTDDGKVYVTLDLC